MESLSRNRQENQVDVLSDAIQRFRFTPAAHATDSAQYWLAQRQRFFDTIAEAAKQNSMTEEEQESLFLQFIDDCLAIIATKENDSAHDEDEPVSSQTITDTTDDTATEASHEEIQAYKRRRDQLYNAREGLVTRGPVFDDVKAGFSLHFKKSGVHTPATERAELDSFIDRNAELRQKAPLSPKTEAVRTEDAKHLMNILGPDGLGNTLETKFTTAQGWITAQPYSDAEKKVLSDFLIGEYSRRGGENNEKLVENSAG